MLKDAESLCKDVTPRPSVFNGPEVTMPLNSEDLHGFRCATKRNSFHRHQGLETICTSAVKMTTRLGELGRIPETIRKNPTEEFLRDFPTTFVALVICRSLQPDGRSFPLACRWNIGMCTMQ